MLKIKNNKLKAFTLIELLVVVAIIGILSGIVIVNLNAARGKGQDSAIKEQAFQLRSSGELFYDGNYGYSTGPVGSPVTGTCPTVVGSVGAFGGTFFADTDTVKALQGIQKNSGLAPTCFLGASNIKSQSWAITAKLRADSGYWCVDSFGSSRRIANATGAVNGTGEANCPDN